jgi:hypothetical protein
VAARLAFWLLAIAGALVAGRSALGHGPFHAATPHLSLSSTRPLYSVAGAQVGDARTGSVTVRNDGGARGRVVMTALTNGSRPLAEQLAVVVRSNGRAVYAGTLAGLRRIDMGVLAPGQSRRVSVRVALGAGGNTRQANRVATSFSWTALEP